MSQKEKKKVIISKTNEKLITTIDQNSLPTIENDLQQQLIRPSIDRDPIEQQILEPSLISSSDLKTTDDLIENIHSINTLNELETFIEQHKKPISILFFYGLYCPYSKRAISAIRQWAQKNQDRIVLYEVNVENGLQLAEYYHVRAIPTIVALNENNYLIPIWQRTATNLYPSDLQIPMNKFESIEKNESISINDNEIKEIFKEKLDSSKNVFFLLDSSNENLNSISKISESLNDTKQEQYLTIFENKQAIGNQSRFIIAITSNTKIIPFK